MAGPIEAPNTLVSNTRLKIIDLVTEGVNAGFVQVSGVSGSNPLCSVIFDDIPVMNGDGSVNWNTSGQGFSFQYTSGASGQSPMVGFEKVEALIPLSFNTRVANPPLNQGNYKPVVASFNTTQYPDAEGVKITLRFPAVYTVNTTNGDTNGFDISWAVDISLDNGPFVEVDARSLSDISSAPKCTSPYYNTKVYPLPKTTPASSFYEWKIRVRRTSENILSTNTQNEMFVDSMAVVSSNTYSYPKSALVGLEITADQFGSIPSRAYEVMGIKVRIPQGYTPTQYDVQTNTITPAVYPGVWNGTFAEERQWTDNPAWIFYDLVTNRRYGLGNYIREGWIDKWSLYQIARYCDEMVDDGKGGLEPRFTCNVAIMQQQDAYTLLNNFVSVFQGMLYFANGSIFPVGSETRDPVFNFTNSNVIGGAFSYSDTPRNTRSTVCVVKWVDPANNYRTTPERIEDINGIGKYGYIEKQITAFACTSRGQAIRAANWLLTVEQLLTETISFQTDLEGCYLRPGDVFNAYDNFRNNQQQGGRISDITQTYTARDTVGLDRNVVLKPGFTYVLSALVPASNWATGQNITGSDQIGMIRNSQIETRTVISSPGTVNLVTVTGGFSPSLYRGSAWILNASGDSVTLFDQSTQYKCLVTSEPRVGVVEVLGVKYNTGVNYLVNNNYSSEVSPPIIGDTTPPDAPTNVTGVPITGLLNDNTFYRYAYVYWTPSPSINTAYYDVSGRLGAGTWAKVGKPLTTGINYVPDAPGTYTFRVAAFNANGYGSAYAEGTYVEPSTNPLGPTAALSGIYIRDNYDPYSMAPAPLNRYTGYLGGTPTFEWNVTIDSNGNETPTAQFISGYRISILRVTDEADYIAPFTIWGKDNTSFTMPDKALVPPTALSSLLAARSLRSYIFSVDTRDIYGNIVSGARLAVNNFQPRPPVGSGFVGYNGGVSYNITPAREADISGVYIWTNALPSFTPTYDNYTYRSTNLAGFAPAPTAGDIYTWFSLVDTYGPSGSIAAVGDYNTPIYGPISGNANQAFGTFAMDITAEMNQAMADIDNAFGLITGTITDSILVVSGQGNLTVQTVNGLSGQVMGTTPGDANTALNVRVNTAVVSSSGSLSQQINAVRAITEQTGIALTATVGSVSTALTNTGVALGQKIDLTAASISGGINGTINASGATLLQSQATAIGGVSSWITNLGAQTTGANAAVRIGAEAMVTGSVNGLGGVAVARYGFELDADGKVVSMQATSSSFPGSYGTIVFGNATLQSDTYVAGSDGWQLAPGGNVELGNAIIRGTFTGGSASSNYLSIDSRGVIAGGYGSSDRIEIPVTTSNSRYISIYNSVGNRVSTLGPVNVLGTYPGQLQINKADGNPGVTILGEAITVNGQATFNGQADFNNTITFDGATTHSAQLNISSTYKIHFSNAGTNVSYIAEDWGINLWGDGTHPVKVRGGSLVRGSSAGTDYGGGNIWGFAIQFDPASALPNTFECDTVAGADNAFTSYLKFKGPGGTTVYVPYQTSAP
jgi:hypothetical protein